MKTIDLVTTDDVFCVVYCYGQVLIKTHGPVYRFLLNLLWATVNLTYQAFRESIINCFKMLRAYTSKKCDAASHTKKEEIQINYCDILPSPFMKDKQLSLVQTKLTVIESEISQVKNLLANINKAQGTGSFVTAPFTVPSPPPPPPVPPPPPPPLPSHVLHGEPTTPLSSVVRPTGSIKKQNLGEKLQLPVITVEALRSVKLSKTVRPTKEKKVAELRSPYISVELLRSVKLRPSKHVRKSLELRSPKSLKAKSSKSPHGRKSVNSHTVTSVDSPRYRIHTSPTMGIDSP